MHQFVQKRSFLDTTNRILPPLVWGTRFGLASFEHGACQLRARGNRTSVLEVDMSGLMVGYGQPNRQDLEAMVENIEHPGPALLGHYQRRHGQ